MPFDVALCLIPVVERHGFSEQGDFNKATHFGDLALIFQLAFSRVGWEIKDPFHIGRFK